MESIERDEPVTPAGRLFLSPDMDIIITCVIGAKDPIDVDAVKTAVENSILVKHPRFCSLMVRDSSGREHWRKIKINVNQHLIIRQEPLTDDPTVPEQDAINDYLADLSVSVPLSTDKPLWELHLLMAHDCVVFRCHHALGDGISLMSMLLSCCRRVDDPSQPPKLPVVDKSGGGRRSWSLCWLVKVLWYTLVYVLEFILRALWLKDRTTVLSGGAGVELWPRKLATASFKLDDMKTVKRAIANATVNDVLLGVLSYGFSKYLEIRSPNSMKEGLRITGVAMVNIRPQPGLQDISKLVNSKSGTRWGNKFGMMLLPVYYHKPGPTTDPLQFVKRAKAMVDKKKQSLEALCSYKIGALVMAIFGVKLASLLNYRVICNTTFTISNVIGPQEEIILAGNSIKYIRVNSTSLPHAIIMHMVSYAGRADMQILVAKEVIPDPKILANCFEDALLEMKEAAEKLNNKLEANSPS